MSGPATLYATPDDWIAHEAIPFSIDSPGTFNSAIDSFIGERDNCVELLGLGEALHGGEDILIFRNRLFQRLVEAHGFGAIAIESSFLRAYGVNEYIAGRGPPSYEAVQENGFSHGFGRLLANRELVEWMRRYNAEPSHSLKLRFYGFDSPTEMTGSDSPRQVLHVVLDYLSSIDGASGQGHRDRIEPLLGLDADWENPAAMMDPAQSVGRSSHATALRIETEDLISELQVRRPEMVTAGNKDHYLEAMHYATVARHLLNYHAEVARASDARERIVRLLGMRDAMMADNLTYIVTREHRRGKVLVFAHNSHLRRGKAEWQLGPHALTWWTAGAHLDAICGQRYAVIGTGVGVSDANGIGMPEPGTLEDRLTAVPGPVRFIPTRRAQALPALAIAALPTRMGSRRNPTYFPLTPHSLTDFDWLAVLDTTTYARGGPPLQT